MKTEVRLISLGDMPNSIPGTHELYEMRVNNTKVAELVHRKSKDTYHINMTDTPFKYLIGGLSAMYGTFNKFQIEKDLGEQFDKMFAALLRFRVKYDNKEIPAREFTVRESEDYPDHYLIADGFNPGVSHIGGGTLLKKYCTRLN